MQTLNSRFWLAGLGIALLAALFVGVPLSAFDDDDDSGREEEIAVDELPEDIRAALEGVEIAEAERVARGDRAVFEVVIEAGDVEFELQLTQNARLLGVEIEEEDDGDEEGEEDDDEEGEDDGEEEDDDEEGDDDEEDDDDASR